MNSFSTPNGYARELQNCLTEAQGVARSRTFANLKRLPALLAAGKFVVVRHNPYYCKATDAFAGEVSSIGSVHDTRESAERASFADGYDDPDSPRTEILPRVAGPARAEIADDVGIPF